MSGYDVVSQNIRNKFYESKITYEDGKWMGGSREDYRADARRLEGEFKKDIRAAYSIEDEKIFNPMYDKAWADGHANGYEEVLSHFDSLFDLMKTLIDEIMELRASAKERSDSAFWNSTPDPDPSKMLRATNKLFAVALDLRKLRKTKASKKR